MIVKCAWCGKTIGEKEPLEDKSVTHGICPECVKKYFPEKKEGNPAYQVCHTIELCHDIEASSKEEAIEIATDRGEVGAKSRLIKDWGVKRGGNPVTGKSRLFLEESAKYIVSSGRQSISEEELYVIASTVGLGEEELKEATAFMQSDEGREAFKRIIRTELWKAGYRP